MKKKRFLLKPKLSFRDLVFAIVEDQRRRERAIKEGKPYKMGSYVDELISKL